MMDDLDTLLSLVENPTRRRILESIVREPSYPLRLSKELGVSQQAVMKNLALMEQNGLVVSYRESSRMGPDRTLYIPNTEFTLVVEMHSSMFSARVIGPSEEGAEVPGMTADEASRRIDEIDDRLEEIDRERAALVSERNGLVRILRGADDDDADGNPQSEEIASGSMEVRA